MCTSYEPAQGDLFEAFTDFPVPRFEYKRETYKDYVAPILRLSEGERRTDPATFGMVPRKHIPPGVKVFDTMNARAETIGEKRSFSGAWKKLQLCLIPCAWFYEPNYETGKPVRWRIGLDNRPLAIAGLWRTWDEPEGLAMSFTMLTVNADDHPLMKRFHRPGAEKRSVVILRPEEYDDWLGARSTDEARSFLNLFPADEMKAEAYPLPPRTSKETLDLSI
ncbi:Putative SOS response-associated peptidase YedK [Paraburkholderia fungorum]|uniref:Abasic site processing protein n=1 Tax=Paraburkholderia fungorum TaxID=134537 RepID=A0A1H1IJX0_9BURK|nr:SOS response-associated peptidase family protein [Paraburkholderia fungorum]SDR37879.1 Putative SOS response-associated peptidase YedK [Paraburkholderia fungorum]